MRTKTSKGTSLTDSELYKLSHPEKHTLPLLTEGYIRELEKQAEREKRNQAIMEKERGE